MDNSKQFDVIIIGGSYAGLSAALALGRSSRKVLIIDGNNSCNRQTPHSHNLLTHDGQKPAEIRNAAKTEVLKYPGIYFWESVVQSVSGRDGNFEIITDYKQELRAST